MRYLLWRQKLAHLLCETSVGPDQESDTIGPKNNNNHLRSCAEGSEAALEPGSLKSQLAVLQPPPPSITISARTPSCLSLERSFSVEEDQQKSVECALQPARVYTITSEHSMLMSNKESLELDVLKAKAAGGSKSGSSSHSNLIQPSSSPSSNSSSPLQNQASGRGTSSSHHHHGNHHGLHHHHSVTGTNVSPSGASGIQPTHQAPHHHGHHHHHLSQPPLHASVSAHNIRGWGEGGKGDSEGCGGSLACETCAGGAPSRSQGSLDLESVSRETGKHHRRLERMWSVDRMTGLERGERGHDTGRGAGEERESKPGGGDDTNWFPKENMFSFQAATTTMQANFRKHLRMVGSRRMKAQSGDLQASTGNVDESGQEDSLDWEEEKEQERQACEGDDFVPPKIMLISSKVPKAEYVPTIIRRDDPSIIPILYDHEHATFDDILEEIEKKLAAYRRGSKFWRMLIFCQGGPGHLYLLKNKVATFAKVEKEEDMSQFWKRLSRLMSKINPEPNLIHIMGCYVLGNPNGEKLFQKLKNLMRPYSVEFESPLELSAQGKEMIEKYFDFRLYRLWKTRQHSKLLDYEDLL
ncbi:NMDA receptor synaptonuclear signaling and neuronal migration factor isoform X2 [Eucyclogobius newberryi]|uniref:NMDA receptor synaptonuclear signaling and neuronal migration factor isoform X2 n=1 Tax=Eucyclogobius newberryi TaxID=166745 RepID=UPI003B59A9D1